MNLQRLQSIERNAWEAYRAAMQRAKTKPNAHRWEERNLDLHEAIARAGR